MIFGEVPYQSKTIDDLLFDITNVGVVIDPEKNQLSQNMVNLIQSLLNPNPKSRISHDELFKIVLEDPNYLEHFLINSSQIQREIHGNPHINSYSNLNVKKSENSVLEKFIQDMKKERYKYTFLINLAKQTLNQKE